MRLACEVDDRDGVGRLDSEVRAVGFVPHPLCDRISGAPRSKHVRAVGDFKVRLVAVDPVTPYGPGYLSKMRVAEAECCRYGCVAFAVGDEIAE